MENSPKGSVPRGKWQTFKVTIGRKCVGETLYSVVLNDPTYIVWVVENFQFPAQKSLEKDMFQKAYDHIAEFKSWALQKREDD